MRAALLFKSQGRRQGAGIPDFKPITKEHDLDAGIAGVVAMNDGIDDGFGNHFLGNFVFRRRLGAFRPCSHPEVYLGEHEILGLIDEIENRAFVHLIRRNGCHFIAVFTSEVIRKRCGCLPNNKMSPLVGRPLSSRLRCTSTS